MLRLLVLFLVLVLVQRCEMMLILMFLILVLSWMVVSKILMSVTVSRFFLLGSFLFSYRGLMSMVANIYTVMIFCRQKGLCHLPHKTSCLSFVRGAGVFPLTKFLITCRSFRFEFSSGQYAGQRLSQFVVASSSVTTSKISS